ncbi:TetR family transcriptional regulator C-terminal domain-containing protein [Streptomyces sp. S465]|uniref:TetR family transcriptional regulator C-terminal domain-containing protein n=1 Tax=Streptomyces sp. S465 TaxID=2979468 RepID=UPI0022A83790|nr:TetR family transcriptional regulator C-terminal domain-containing protein [Streptomyces sp. S465]WAP58009.1 TetR family transcriptional regulator C-terminal domain-containing protein [Streptomyces sp. S465]
MSSRRAAPAPSAGPASAPARSGSPPSPLPGPAGSPRTRGLQLPRHRQADALLLAWNAGERDQTFARGQAERYETWYAEVQALVERGRDEGDFRCDDPADFTLRFSALADGLALRRLRQVPTLSVADARRHLRRSVDAELRG